MSPIATSEACWGWPCFARRFTALLPADLAPFPAPAATFWYTLSSLVEMDVKPAIEEMRFAARRCESAALRNSTEKYAQRRIELAKRVLAKL